ncbi:MAG: hypothetical protein ABSE90_05345 [Verrucomicrobiota bacterium]|jgi:hypothetical protein
MAETANRLESLQFSRRETARLALALALSLAAHLSVWGSYEAGKRLDVWRLIPRLAWLQPAPKMNPAAPKTEPPLEFVMVEQPSTEAPKSAKYYSSKNSRAANPDANRDDNVPKLNGTQTEVAKTETVPKPDFNKLQPAPRPVNPKPAQPTPAVGPGDLSLGKPREQTPPRPRTIQEALAQSQPHRSPGVEMKQDGGVHRVALSPSFDAKATPFGQYDSDFVDAVTYRWYSLLDSQKFALDRTGKVMLRFHLNYDGTITDMTELQNSVGVLLGYVCQKAINDPAPFKPWPEDMRRLVGANYREITFTFYYY